MRLYLDPAALLEVADATREQYAAGDPFPHAYFDGLFPDEALDLAIDAFPSASSNVWKEYDNYHEVKLETQGEERVPPDLQLLLYQFNSAPFLRFLERLTGIDGLIPDPYFNGGGLHQIVPGGRLGIHADFSRHPTLPLHRRLNAIVFLNRDWREEYGGDLELWNRDMSECRARIAPQYNRLAVFSTTDWSFHGHPEPLRCPEGMTRKSIALYYFTVERPEGETIPGKESTRFNARPGEAVPRGTPSDRGAAYTGLKADRYAVVATRTRIARTVQRLTPPVLFDAALGLRRRAR
jgi:hypothetical protein